MLLESIDAVRDSDDRQLNYSRPVCLCLCIDPIEQKCYWYSSTERERELDPSF